MEDAGEIGDDGGSGTASGESAERPTCATRATKVDIASVWLTPISSARACVADVFAVFAESAPTLGAEFAESAPRTTELRAMPSKSGSKSRGSSRQTTAAAAMMILHFNFSLSFFFIF